MARPRKQQQDALSDRLSFRLLPDERAAVDQRAADSGLSPSDYARRLVTRARMTTVVARRADPTLVLALNRIGVNLNQIARTLNSDNFKPGLHDDLSATLLRLNQMLDRMQGDD